MPDTVSGPSELAEIPRINFLKQTRAKIEFDTFKLSSLFARRDKLDHPLDGDHRIRFYAILLITEGTGVHRIDFHPYPYETGSIIFVSKDQIHAFDDCFRSEGILILFTEQFLIKNVIHSDILFLHRLFNYHLNTPLIQPGEQTGDNFAAIFNDIHTEYHATEEHAKEAVLRAYLKILLLKAERLRKRSFIFKEGKPSWIDLFTRFKVLVTEHHSETRNAKDYAARLGISYKHLNQICKNVTGNTPKQFIDTYLILEIKRQLSISNLSVKELTYDFGFDEPTNFLKFFKKHTHQTPTQFRRALVR